MRRINCPSKLSQPAKIARETQNQLKGIEDGGFPRKPQVRKKSKDLLNGPQTCQKREKRASGNASESPRFALFSHLLVQTKICNFVDDKQDNHYTGCHLNRHSNNGLLEKDPRRNRPEENKKKQHPRLFLLLDGKRPPANPIDHAASSKQNGATRDHLSKGQSQFRPASVTQQSLQNTESEPDSCQNSRSQ